MKKTLKIGSNDIAKVGNNPLFEFFNKMISVDVGVYESISDKEKMQHGFMLNRYMSAEYPLFANELNKHQMNGILICEYWRFVFLKRRYSQLPNFFWLKTASKHSKENKKLDRETMEKICQNEGIKKENLLHFLDVEPEKGNEILKQYKKRGII